jgi:hypothetical protein
MPRYFFHLAGSGARDIEGQEFADDEAARNEVDLRELNSAAVSIPPSPEELAALIRGCRPPTAAPTFCELTQIKERARRVVTNPGLTLVDVEAPAQLLITK